MLLKYLSLSVLLSSFFCRFMDRATGEVHKPASKRKYNEIEQHSPIRIEQASLTKCLRRNPPEVRVTSGQKPCTKIIYIVLKTSVGLFSISSKDNSFLTTPNVENEC